MSITDLPQDSNPNAVQHRMIKALLTLVVLGSIVGCGDDKSSDDGGGGSSASEMTAFGSACDVDADCEAPTDYCAAPPMATKFCTASLTSCDEAAATCPEGWSCLDLNAFGIPKIICERPR
ncbi:MAG TPA: hypothetical protein VMG12_37690 [Polyangiaceae bacterium]|nr:hypothetical protein [Polyangiaceae bacterium]